MKMAFATSETQKQQQNNQTKENSMSYTVEEIAQLNESMEAAILSIKAANNILEEMMATGRIYVEEE